MKTTYIYRDYPWFSYIAQFQPEGSAVYVKLVCMFQTISLKESEFHGLLAIGTLNRKA